jgi:hypothetical protein
MFSSVLESVEPRSCRIAGEQWNTVLVGLRWPRQIHQLQRRAYERATPPRGNVIAVRCWQEQRRSGKAAETRRVRHGQLDDLSAGGMRLRMADATDMQIGHTYRCAFTPHPGSQQLIVEAILRHRQAESSPSGRLQTEPRPSGRGCEGEPSGQRQVEAPVAADLLVDRVSLGFQFIGLEASPEGQRTLDRLARIVSKFQRARGVGRLRPARGT